MVFDYGRLLALHGGLSVSLLTPCSVLLVPLTTSGTIIIFLKSTVAGKTFLVLPLFMFFLYCINRFILIYLFFFVPLRRQQTGPQALVMFSVPFSWIRYIWHKVTKGHLPCDIVRFCINTSSCYSLRQWRLCFHQHLFVSWQENDWLSKWPSSFRWYINWEAGTPARQSDVVLL